MKTLTLHDGGKLPAFGLGTWKSKPGEVGTAVTEAIRLGYRHIDCAAIYGNEAEVGEALAKCFADGLVTRDDLWITSKLWNSFHAPDDVLPALRKTLSELRLEQLDLYLMHWPVALPNDVVVPENGRQMIDLGDLPVTTTWQAMEAGVDQGLTRYLGVSNFSLKKTRGLCAEARIQPAINQVEMHPYLRQQELVDGCRELGVAITAYSPLGSPDRPDGMRLADEPVLLEDPTLATVAARVGATKGQVLIAWALQRGTSVIPKSVNPKRLAENLAACDVRLDAVAMQELDGLDRHRRYVDGEFWVFEDGPYTLANLWDE